MKAKVGQLRLGADIVIGTPGRTLDFLKGDLTRGLTPPLSCEKVLPAAISRYEFSPHFMDCRRFL